MPVTSLGKMQWEDAVRPHSASYATVIKLRGIRDVNANKYSA